MSDQTVEFPAVADEGDNVGPAPADRSLAARLRRRGEQLSHELTTIIPIPGWDDILSVELRALPYQTIRGIQKRNVRMPDEAVRELYNYADELVAATVAFYEDGEDGRRRLDGETWSSLARAAFDDLPDDLRPRQAIIKLVGDTRLHFLAGTWVNWAESFDIEEETTRDF